MFDFNKSFEEIASPNKFEESIRQFSNWILGISIAVCSFLILESRDLIQDSTCYSILVKILLSLSMACTLISGLTKYMLLNRDIKLSIKQDIFKRIIVDLRLKKISFEEAKIDWDNHMRDWTSVFSTIGLIGKVFNLSIALTTLTIIFTGIFILVTI